MRLKTINSYLIIAILTLSVLPLIASYFLIDDVLINTTSLAVKPETQQLLKNYQQDLKHLKALEPQLALQYKNTFLQVSNELLVYQQPELFTEVLRNTYLTYFMVIFIFVLVVSLLAALLLTRQVSRSYKKLKSSDIDKAKKLQELSHFKQWQQIAAKLAHEINNPLTPIEMMVSNLPRIHGKVSYDSFIKSLNDTQQVVQEEVHKLKQMVNHFSQFSKLPAPKVEPCIIGEYFDNFIEKYQHSWPSCVFSITINDKLAEQKVNIDPLLMNQSLINLLNNAVQANPQLEEMAVTFNMSLLEGNKMSVVIFNQGQCIAEDDLTSVFTMYYSTKTHSENKGLGLSIVKKIMLDQGADIVCLPENNGAAFQLTLPLAT